MTTDAGDVVLDPFIGTSTTAIAAKQLGRNFIGIEVDTGYVDIAKRKIEQATETGKTADVWVSINNGEIITIRDKDWRQLKDEFVIPQNIADIDFERIRKN